MALEPPPVVSSAVLAWGRQEKVRPKLTSRKGRSVEWVREHFFEILAAGGGLIVLSWLYSNAARLLRSGPRKKFYCRQCNWEGSVRGRRRRCGRCGSTDLSPVTH